MLLLAYTFYLEIKAAKLGRISILIVSIHQINNKHKNFILLDHLSPDDLHQLGFIIFADQYFCSSIF